MFAYDYIMKRVIICILLWTLVIGWMCFIFSMSAQPAEVSKKTSGNTLEKIYQVSHDDTDSSCEQKEEEFVEDNQSIIRRAAHFGIFTVLGILISCAALYTFTYWSLKYVMPFAVAVLYPIVDELYQISVPGRAFEWKDLGLDILGGVLGCIFVYLIFGAAGKLKKK